MNPRALLVLALVILCSPLSAATLNFFDGSLSNSNWTDGFVTNGGASSGSTQIPTGGSGDNGPYRQTTHAVPGGFIFVNDYHLTNALVYNPATQGAILSLDFSIDYNTFGSTIGQGFVVAQGSNIWFGGYNAFATGGNWVSRSSGPLTAIDFLDQGFFAGGMPDFSANGAPITFGYNTANSSTGSGYSTVGGYDNFSLTITHDPSTALIPEPAAILPLALAAMALRLRRRR